MADIIHTFTDMGATPQGECAADGYRFESSKAFSDGKFVGLPLDEVNESEKSDERIANWLNKLSI